MLADRTLRVLNDMDLAPCDGCDACGLRCAAGVAMTRDEYERVQRYIERSPESVGIQRVMTQDKRVGLGDGVVVTMCRYRDMARGRCAIYTERPLVCRLLGHVEWMPCPIEKIRRRVPTEQALELMAAYAEYERRTFEGWEERP